MTQQEFERKAFEDAIRKDRYDEVTRRVFADWLEEHGYDDEATEQRRWTPRIEQAKEYLEECATSCAFSYQDLVAAAHRRLDAVEGDSHYLLIVEGMDTPSCMLLKNMPTFWKEFALATGRSVEPEQRDWKFVSCAC